MMARLYQRNGMFYVDYLVPGTDRRRRRSLKTRDPGEAHLLKQAYEAKLLERRLRGGQSAPVKINAGLLPVTQLCQQFMTWARANYSASEVTVLEIAVAALTQARGRALVVDIGPSDIHAVRDVLLQRNLARSTINGAVARMKRIFKWGVERELVPAVVSHGIDAVSPLRPGEAKATAPVTPVADEAIRAVLQCVPPPVADMMRLQLLTAARGGELCIMRPQDVDREAAVWLYRPQAHKTRHRGRTRVIYIGPKGQGILRPYLFRRPEDYCFAPEGAGAKRAHYTPDVYRKAIRRACERLNIGVWTPHQLRHTAATRINARANEDAARIMLGHASVATTQIYAEVDHQKAMRLAEEVG